MRPRSGNHQGTLRGGLALHFAKVRIRLGLMQQTTGLIRRNHRAPVEMRDQLQQVTHRNHPQPRRQAGFLGVYRRNDQRPLRRTCRQRSRQHTLNRPNRPRQRQLAQALNILQRNQRHLPAGGQQPQRNRQIKPPAILGQISRRKVECDAPRRKIQP